MASVVTEASGTSLPGGGFSASDATAVTSTESRSTRARTRTGVWLRRAAFYALLVAGWGAVSRSGIWPTYVLPGPDDVFRSLVSGFATGLFIHGAAVSLGRIALGYSMSVVLGTLLGLLIGRVRLAEELLGSLVLGLQSLPSVCWLPLAVLWFGLTERAILFVVIMGALFSITQGVAAAVKNTPPVYVKAARNLGAHGLGLYTQVILPAGLPTLLSGLKQGWSFAWRSLMAAELLFFTLSLGNLLQSGRDLNDAARVIAVMIIIMVIGIACDQVLFAPVERRVRLRRGLAG